MQGPLNDVMMVVLKASEARTCQTCLLLSYRLSNGTPLVLHMGWITYM